MPSPFTYEAPGNRVVYGAGALAQLAGEVERLGTRVLVIVSPGRADRGRALADRLGARACGVLATARVHVPAELAAASIATARELGADCTVTYGGGSAIGLGKAIARELGLPQLAIPTTYSGSEQTPVWGMTESGAKRTGRDRRVQPRTVIYDVELTLDLPARITAASAINALAHACEAIYSAGANPITSLLAEQAIREIAGSVREVVRDGRDRDARDHLLYGAYLAGYALGSVPMALHHQLCHALGGAFDLPHAELHAVVLPHALAYTAPAAPEAFAQLGRALGVHADNVAPTIAELVRALDLPASLAELGVPHAGLAAVARRLAEQRYPTPRPVDEAAAITLLERIYARRTP